MSRLVINNLNIRITNFGRAFPEREFSNIDLLKLHPEFADKSEKHLAMMDERIKVGFGFDKRFLVKTPLESVHYNSTTESLAKKIN